MPGIGVTRTVGVHELNLFHKNARRGNVEAIKGSLKAHGQFRPIVVNEGSFTGRHMEVLAGNHTLKAMRELTEDDPTQWGTIDVYLVDVDEERATKIVLADNRTAELGNYDNEALAELLNDVNDLEGTGFTEDAAADLLGELSEPDNQLGDKYTSKITAPQYEPQDEYPPPLNTLMDTEKTDQLIQQIHNTDLPVDVQTFLTAAAHRHTVFHYGQVAEYYAHQPPEIQKLMEDSALVIIDADEAIAHGYMKLRAKLLDQNAEEHPNA